MVKATVNLNLTIQETVSDSYASSKDNTITLNGLNSTIVMDADSTPPVTKEAVFQKAMTAGAATIDLTALTGLNGASVTFTGLKVQSVKFRNKATNANDITITEGASNGYELLGNGFTLILKPGQEAQFYLNDAAPDVGGSAKTIDISGTGTQVLEVAMVAG